MTLTGEAIVIDPMLRELMESAATGEAAKLFIQSELGGHIARCAADEVDAAIAELIDADPNDAKTISGLQMRIKVAKQGVAWLTDAMTAGEHAMRQIETE